MVLDSTLKKALVASVVFHGVIFFSMPQFNILTPKNAQKRLEFTYVKPREKPALVPEKKKMVLLPGAGSESKAQNSVRTSQAKEEKTVVKEKEFVKTVPAAAKVQEEPKRAVSSAIRRDNDVFIPPISAKIKSMPEYMDYAESIRNKIRRIARRLANQEYYTSHSAGDVLLYFVLLSDGTLSKVKIIDERSYADEKLRRIASDAIEQSSPFEPFPQDLGFKQLTFSIVISFE